MTSSEVFVPNLGLRESLQAVRARGAAFVERALAGSFLRRLQQEVEVCPFEAVAAEIGPVRQETELFVIWDPMEAHPAVAQLRGELVRLVRAHGRGIRGLATYYPNEAYVQRYRPGALGITPHRDGKRFARLVAVFTTHGAARFALLRDRAGAVLEEWKAVPGSLVLLRAPGLGGLKDGRPFHAVGGPIDGERFTVTFRMNTRPGE